MARTKASVGAKISSGKSTKAGCSVAPPSSSAASGSSSDKSSRSGGNSVCPRETPKWQKPITNFFICKDAPSSDGEGSSQDAPRKRRPNVIESDDEDSSEDKTGDQNEDGPKAEEDGPEPEEDGPKLGESNGNASKESNDSESKVEPKMGENVNGPKLGELEERPKNRVLDDTIELEPLEGENCHKIDEYFDNNDKKVKNKGVGKKTKGKENVNKTKREFDEIDDDEEVGSKRMKV